MYEMYMIRWSLPNLSECLALMDNSEMAKSVNLWLFPLWQIRLWCQQEPFSAHVRSALPKTTRGSWAVVQSSLLSSGAQLAQRQHLFFLTNINMKLRTHVQMEPWMSTLIIILDLLLLVSMGRESLSNINTHCRTVLPESVVTEPV